MKNARTQNIIITTLAVLAPIRCTITRVAAAFVVSLSAITATAQTPPTPAQDKQIAIDAYIYGYPLVTLDWTRRVITNVKKPEAMHAPMGDLIRMREYPTAAFKDVTAPNVDTRTRRWTSIMESAEGKREASSEWASAQSADRGPTRNRMQSLPESRGPEPRVGAVQE